MCVLAHLQATIRPPAVKNMYRSIVIQYTFAVTLWVAITFVGYWCALYHTVLGWHACLAKCPCIRLSDWHSAPFTSMALGFRVLGLWF